VLSVKLFSRVPVAQVRTLALDEGSRTSAALVRILLNERAGIVPQCEPLPIGASLADTRRQLVLRTFASTKGDIARTAKIVGISTEDVRGEISSLMHGNGDMRATEVKSAAVPAGASGDGARPRGGPAKAKAKKR